MLQILPLTAFNDNYIWLIRQPNSQNCWVVDPGDAAPVKSYLAKEGLNLAGILLTHHHADHTGGVAELAQAGVEVVGSAKDASRLPKLTQAVSQDSKVKVLDVEFTALEVDGHTLGHLAFVAEGILFSGDTLFAGGCGRRFEGTAEQMYASLTQLANLAANTQVYAAHEYTLSNLDFALAVDPNNTALQERMKTCQALRQNNQPTLPSLLSDELATNPFLRVEEAVVQEAVKTNFTDEKPQTPSEFFDLLRRWKDDF